MNFVYTLVPNSPIAGSENLGSVSRFIAER